MFRTLIRLFLWPATALAAALIPSGTVHAACFTTPAAALKASADGLFRSSALDPDGYRVAMIRTDALLGRRWAKIVDCAHPGWPAVEIALPAATTPASMHPGSNDPEALPMVIRAGQNVRLWLQQDTSRIEATGVSEQNSPVGGAVTVRIALNNNGDGLKFQELKGIVRGPAEVEIQP